MASNLFLFQFGYVYFKIIATCSKLRRMHQPISGLGISFSYPRIGCNLLFFKCFLGRTRWYLQIIKVVEKWGVIQVLIYHGTIPSRESSDATTFPV